MPLLKRVHGVREKHNVWAELTFPPRMYKARQGIFPLRTELMEKDPAFKQDVAKIRAMASSQSMGSEQANSLYFKALDDAIRRRQKKAA